jgi:hypothetical protein
VSNSLALAAVTATLQSILQSGITQQADLADTTVTILPLDKARGSNTTNQLNLFLYMINRNAAFANSPMPGVTRPGESAYPPLPLNLYFLITAFGRDDDAAQPYGHELLGRAMALMHDHPFLSGDEIRAATSVLLPDADLDRQPERVRITLHPLTIDELSKLWTGFAMQYRLSAAYEVAVTLLESARANRTPLPVLTRGKKDNGVDTQPNLTPPGPTLSAIKPPNSQESVRLGEIVTVAGVKLDGTNVALRLTNALIAALNPGTANPGVEITADPGAGSKSASFTIFNPASTALPAGLYSASVRTQRPGDDFLSETNVMALAVAPLLTLTPLKAPAGSVIFTATVAPQVWPQQRVSLLLGEVEIVAAPRTSPTNTLTFAASNLAAGTIWPRLRVDGVDSLLVDRTVSPPQYDPSLKVTLT